MDDRTPIFTSKLVHGAGILVGAAFVANFLAQPFRTFRVQPWAGDFDAFGGAGRLLLQGDGHLLYSPAAQAAAESAYTGVHLGGGQLFVNPAAAAALLAPLMELPFHTALVVFTVGSIACVGLSAFLLLRVVLRCPLISTSGLVVIVATASVASGWNLVMANWDCLLLLCLTCAILALQAQRPLAAGVLLSILFIKPQLIWLAPIFLLMASQWRVLLGLSIGAVAWVAASVLVTGPAPVLQGVHLAFTLGAIQASMGTGIPGLLALLIPGGGVVTVVCLTVGVLAVSLVSWWLREALRADPALAIAFGLTLSLLLSPHILPTDLALLGVPIVLWARRAPSAALWSSLFLSAAVWPYATGIGSPAEVHFALLPQLVVAGGVAWALIREAATLSASQGPLATLTSPQRFRRGPLSAADRA